MNANLDGHDYELLIKSYANFGHDGFVGRVSHAGNMALAKAGGQCLIEVLCFYQTFVLSEKLVLLNARLRQAPKRYPQLQRFVATLLQT